MKNGRMLFVVLLFCLCSVGGAVETTIVPGDTLLKAMHRMGCMQEWLSVVMRESNILESELTSLQIGMHVYAPDICGTELPSTEDIAVTSKIFKNQSKLRLRQGAVVLFNTASDSPADVVESSEDRQVSQQVSGGLVVSGPKFSEKKFGSRVFVAAISGSSLVSFCLSALVWFVWWRRFQDRTKLVPYVRKVPWSTFSQPNGARYFDLSRVLYRCPDHANDEIEDKNLEHHLRKCHYDIQDKLDPVQRKEQQLALIQRRLGRAGIS